MSKTSIGKESNFRVSHFFKWSYKNVVVERDNSAKANAVLQIIQVQQLTMFMTVLKYVFEIFSSLRFIHSGYNVQSN